jgi:hypothetical protein
MGRLLGILHLAIVLHYTGLFPSSRDIQTIVATNIQARILSTMAEKSSSKSLLELRAVLPRVEQTVSA